MNSVDGTSVQCCVAKVEATGCDLHSVHSKALAHSYQHFQLEGKNIPQIFTECLCCVLSANSHLVRRFVSW